jgi:hypothetical protein
MKTCNKEGCAYPSFGKGYCRSHQYLRTGKSVPTLRKCPERPVMACEPYLKSKPTGERVMFQAIWNTRPHKSQLSDKPIHEARPGNFAHLHAKGKRPDLRLFDINICILTLEEHFLFDQGTVAQRETYAIENSCDWSVIERLKQAVLS